MVALVDRFTHASKVTRTSDCHTPVRPCIWLQKVISSPLADRLPTARSRDRWPQGKSRPRSSSRAGRSERRGRAHGIFRLDTAGSCIVDHWTTGHLGTSCRHGLCVHQGGEVNERFFFSLQGVDINDDDALESFAIEVWKHVSAAWGKANNNDRPQPHE